MKNIYGLLALAKVVWKGASGLGYCFTSDPNGIIVLSLAAMESTFFIATHFHLYVGCVGYVGYVSNTVLNRHRCFAC